MLQNPAKKLRRIYKIALFSIGALVLLEQVLFTDTFEGQFAESRFINLSGNQRTLCQKLAKVGLLLATTDNVAGFTKRKDEFVKTYELWVKNHKALKEGDTGLGLPADHNSPIVIDLLSRIEPHFVEIQKACIVLINAQHRHNSISPNSLTIQRILQHEPDFTNLMDQVTNQYEAEARERATVLEITEIALAVTTYVILIAMGFVVFRPSVKAVEEFFFMVTKKNKELEQMNQDLRESKEAIQQQAEELRTTEEELRQNAEELMAVNDHLEQQNSTISRQADRMDEMLKELTTNRREIARKNDSITSSIKYAFRIQNAILPRDEDLKKVFSDSFLFFQPRDIVSGDFVWIHKKEEISIIVVADCTGHGIPGAFMSIIGNLILKDIIQHGNIFSPDEVLNQLHEGIKDTLRQNETQLRDGMDIGICVVNFKERFMEFSGAKNNLYYIQQTENGNKQELVVKGDKMPIGGREMDVRESYQKYRIELTGTTHFYLYSDGYQDQFGGEKDTKFMAKKFRKLLFDNHTRPMADQQKILHTTMKEWMGTTHKQLDDITVFGAKV